MSHGACFAELKYLDVDLIVHDCLLQVKYKRRRQVSSSRARSCCCLKPAAGVAKLTVIEGLLRRLLVMLGVPYLEPPSILVQCKQINLDTEPAATALGLRICHKGDPCITQWSNNMRTKRRTMYLPCDRSHVGPLVMLAVAAACHMLT